MDIDTVFSTVFGTVGGIALRLKHVRSLIISPGSSPLRQPAPPPQALFGDSPKGPHAAKRALHGSMLFDLHDVLIDPEEPNRIHSWVDVVFAGLHYFTLWNAAFITTEGSMPASDSRSL